METWFLKFIDEQSFDQVMQYVFYYIYMYMFMKTVSVVSMYDFM